MAYTFYKSKVDGTIDTPIVSDEVGALFSTLTSQERIAGDTEFAKMWIMSDVDVTAFIGLNSPSPYSSNVFLAATDTAAEADLTGSELRYGALEVVSCTATDLIVTKNADYDLVRNGDTMVVSAKAYDVDSLTDNGDGTLTIGAANDFSPTPSAGAWVTSIVKITLVTATAKPIWREEKIAPGSAYISQYATADILIAD